jgi:hypothetical protein
MSRKYGGVNVHSTYVQTRGFVADLLHYGAMKMGVATHPVTLIKENMNDCIANMHGDGTNFIGRYGSAL